MRRFIIITLVLASLTTGCVKFGPANRTQMQEVINASRD